MFLGDGSLLQVAAKHDSGRADEGDREGIPGRLLREGAGFEGAELRDRLGRLREADAYSPESERQPHGDNQKRECFDRGLARTAIDQRRDEAAEYCSYEAQWDVDGQPARRDLRGAGAKGEAATDNHPGHHHRHTNEDRQDQITHNRRKDRSQHRGDST